MIKPFWFYLIIVDLSIIIFSISISYIIPIEDNTAKISSLFLLMTVFPEGSSIFKISLIFQSSLPLSSSATTLFANNLSPPNKMIYHLWKINFIKIYGAYTFGTKNRDSKPGILMACALC